MKYRVISTPEAEDDIAAAFEWILSRSPQNSATWLDGLEVAMASLERFPKRCPVAQESAAFAIQIRQLVYFSHRVLFSIRGRTVYILHVRHAAQRAIGGSAAPEEE